MTPQPIRALSMGVLLVTLGAGCSHAPTAIALTSPVPSWMILKKGTHAILPQAPWPNGPSLPAVVTSKIEWQTYYDNTGYVPNHPRRATMGERVVITSDYIEGQSYGGGGAFLDGFVQIQGRDWKGVTRAKLLIPVVPANVGAIIVPEGASAPVYATANALEPFGRLERYAKIRTIGISISAIHPEDERSARLHVSVESGPYAMRTGYVDLDVAAIRGLAPDEQNDTSVNDACRCEFIEMIPDFVANRYRRT